VGAIDRNGWARSPEYATIPKVSATKRVKKGSNGSSEELKIREVTDAVHAAYEGRLWYHCENFRLYESGYWRKTDQRTEIVKPILEDFPWLTAAGSNEVVETLKILCSSPDASNGQDQMQIDQELMRRLICMRNGTLDPITGQLLPHAREYRRLCTLDMDWNPTAQAPRFLQFLDEIWGMESDFTDRVNFLQEFMGYMLLPSNKFERFLWLTGSGANGKSVLLELMANMVGRENTTWVHLDRLNKTAVRASLEGVMLNISTEMNADGTMADGYLKSITSGEPIDAEPKYKAPYSFIPTVKLVAATNHLPRLKDTSGGFARRAVILSCNKVFTKEERDADLGKKLASELDGILVWAVDGLKRLLARNHFAPPPSSDATVQTYRTEADSVAMFNHECLDPCSVGTTSGELYAAYRDFCTTNGFQPTNVAIFGRRLTEVNVGTLRKSGGKPIRAAKFRVPILDDQVVMAKQSPSNVRTLNRKGTKVSADEMFGEHPMNGTAF
jgi:putative DNA primase/helicase